MTTFATRVLSTRVRNPTPLTWVFICPREPALIDYWSSGASDPDRVRTIARDYWDYCVYASEPRANLLQCMGQSVYDLCFDSDPNVIVVRITCTTYDDLRGGTGIPSEVETTDQLLDLR